MDVFNFIQISKQEGWDLKRTLCITTPQISRNLYFHSFGEKPKSVFFIAWFTLSIRDHLNSPVTALYLHYVGGSTGLLRRSSTFVRFSQRAFPAGQPRESHVERAASGPWQGIYGSRRCAFMTPWASLEAGTEELAALRPRQTPALPARTQPTRPRSCLQTPPPAVTHELGSCPKSRRKLPKLRASFRGGPATAAETVRGPFHSESRCSKPQPHLAGRPGTTLEATSCRRQAVSLCS